MAKTTTATKKNPNVKTFYVLRYAHDGSSLYIKSVSGTFTKDRGQALCFATPEEAESSKTELELRPAWQVVPVEYDTKQGKVLPWRRPSPRQD